MASFQVLLLALTALSGTVLGARELLAKLAGWNIAPWSTLSIFQYYEMYSVDQMLCTGSGELHIDSIDLVGDTPSAKMEGGFCDLWSSGPLFVSVSIRLQWAYNSPPPPPPSHMV